MRVVSEEQVKSLVDDALALKAVEDAYRQYGLTPNIQSRPPLLTIDGPRPSLGKAEFGQFTIKGAGAPQMGAAGVLLYNRDYPYVMLWELATSKPIGLVSCYWMSLLRVGLTALAAARRLSPPIVNKIALFGGGRYASETGRLLAQEWPDAEFHVVTSNIESATAFARRLPGKAIASDDHEAAIRGADIIVTISNANEAFVRAGWLKPGALLLSMGGVHELDIAVLREVDGLIVDDLAYALNQGDLGAWTRRKEMSDEELNAALRGTIGDVFADHIPGRNGPDERLLVVLQGLTACEIAVAKVVLEEAEARNVGQMVEL